MPEALWKPASHILARPGKHLCLVPHRELFCLFSKPLLLWQTSTVPLALTAAACTAWGWPAPADLSCFSFCSSANGVAMYKYQAAASNTVQLCTPSVTNATAVIGLRCTLGLRLPPPSWQSGGCKPHALCVQRVVEGTQEPNCCAVIGSGA